MKLIQKIIDSVLPPRCPISGEIVDLQGTVAPEAWKTLSFISSPQCGVCGFPFEFSQPESLGDTLCAACLYEKPEYTKARASLVYDDASRDFILAFKHGDQTHSVTTMVPWLQSAGSSFLKDIDAIVPVPLHRWRLLRRRYNQSALMGRALARSVQKEFWVDALVRARSTPPQGHLNVHERQKNVRHAFKIADRRAAFIKGKKIVLVDDVYTTGSTVRECARLLLKAGADSVFVLCLARVVRPTHIG